MVTKNLDTTVIGLYGLPIADTTPNAGQVLFFNGTYWIAADPTFGGGSAFGPSPPALPVDGDLWFDTNASTLMVWDGSAWVPSYPDSDPFLPLAGGTMLGPIVLSGNATAPLQPVALQQLSAAVGNYLPLSGGTLTGPLVLAGDATLPLGAVTLEQLEAAIGSIPPPGSTVVVSETMPASPEDGDLWWDLTTAKLFLYDGLEWVVVVNTPEGGGGGGGGMVFQTGPGLSFDQGTIPPTLDVATPYLPLSGGTVAGSTTIDTGGVVTANLNASDLVTIESFSATALTIPNGGANIWGPVVVGGTGSSGSFTVNDVFTTSTGIFSCNAVASIAGVEFPGGTVITPPGDNSGFIGLAGTAWSIMSAYTFAQQSDPRLKENLGPAPSGALDKVNAIPIHRFTFTRDASKAPHTGFDASEVQSVFPDGVIVGEDEAHTLGVGLGDMVAILWQAVQELSQKVGASA